MSIKEQSTSIWDRGIDTIDAIGELATRFTMNAGYSDFPTGRRLSARVLLIPAITAINTVKLVSSPLQAAYTAVYKWDADGADRWVEAQTSERLANVESQLRETPGSDHG